MEPGGSESPPGSPSGGRALRRYGPLIGIVAVIAIVVVVVAVSGGDGDGSGSDSGSGESADGLTVELESGETVTLPEGVIPFSVAEAEGLDIDWPDTCDTDRGQAALPTYFSPECYAPYEGDNGGATEQGVTEDSIKVVLYVAQDDDPILDAIVRIVSNDTSEEVIETNEKLIPLFEDYFETYGRSVDLEIYEATGGSLDEVAARSDAVKIATEMQPFAVWSSPILTNAFSDELAAQGVMNITLQGGEQPEYYAERDPYLWSLTMSPSQGRQHSTEYICKRLQGRPAEHAGDEAFRDQERKFGLVYIDAGPESAKTLEDFEDGLGDCGVELAAIESYENPLAVDAVAPSIIGKMKDAGVTTLIFAGDPLTPSTLTPIATEQEYFPEWLVVGAAFTDATTFARTYDPEQWSHAFGVSFLAARQDPKLASAYQLYTWFNCEEPPADDGVELLYAIPTLFYSVVQGIGPDLTYENFRNALFAAEPTTRAITNPSLSWGEPSKGRWDEVDYQGIDDATEIWWNPDATGPDEIGNEGSGMYMFVDGGKRYLLGEWPEDDPKVFDEDGAVAIYDEAPEGEEYPDYESPCAGEGEGAG
jgi:hypothetical protein